MSQLNIKIISLTALEKVSPDDAVGHEKLCTVNDEPWEVTEKENDDNADENASKIDLMISRAIPVRPHMRVPSV